ncbi:phage major capsid protein [Crassaminicella thermophila]|uniref:Phage major capsid protein n=1 Tax=Crassaminicella thermophila TaxID=2599308 RepID=A0A5C0SFL5_CRATE|nr:phage major capsid protein [Crassaminicella thermophila]QEK12586.1 phage major capsid protein [Crassaminicella thermophila]
MNKQQYLEKRNALLAEVENLIADGNIEDSNVKMQEIEQLDAKWEQIKLANANMNALKDKTEGIDLEGNSVDVKDGKLVDNVVEKKTVDKKQEYQNAWAKVMMGQSLTSDEKMIFDEINTKFKNSIQTTSTHQIVIPETVTENIWKEAAALFPILDDTRMTFVPGDLTILKEINSGEDGAWYDEDSAAADGGFEIGQLNLSGCELAKTIPISWKLRKMSIDAFIPYITSLLAEKMGAALAKGIVSGKGKPGTGDTFKPQPKGVVTALEAEAGTPQIIIYDPDAATPDPLTYDKIALAMGKIKSAYKSGASIYATSTTIWSELALLKDNMGRPLLIPDVTSGGVGRIFGLPVKEDDSVEEGAILIGNVARGYAMNVNENMTIYTEDHIKERYTDYMSYAIVDGDVLTTKAFALIKKVITG